MSAETRERAWDLVALIISIAAVLSIPIGVAIIMALALIQGGAHG